MMEWLGPVDWFSLLASVGVSLAAALLATCLGAVFAMLVHLTNFPGGRGLWMLVCLPFFAPPTVWALAQTYCYGAGGVLEIQWGDAWRPVLDAINRGHYPATILVLAQVHVPIVLLICGRGMEQLPQRGWEAACLYLSPVRWFCWLANSVGREAIGAGLIVFAMCLGNFSIPHVLQCRLFVIEVYSRMTNYLDPVGAARSAVFLLGLAVVGAIAGVSVQPASARLTPDPHRSYRLPLGRWIWLVGPLVVVYLVATTGLPLGALLFECRSAKWFLDAAADAAPETASSLRTGIAAVVFALLAAGCLTGGLSRDANASWSFRMFLAATLAVPPLLIGLAISRSIHSEWSLDISGLSRTSLLVVLGLGLRGLPFAVFLMAEGRNRIAPEWLEAAQLGQPSSWRRWRWVVWPLRSRDMAAAGVLLLALAISDVEMTQLLCAPGQGTLALRLFSFLHFGPAHVTAALATLQLLLATIPALVFVLLMDRSN